VPKTDYIYTITAAVPANLIEAANHLACLMGESAADIRTFRQARYQDASGTQYAVCHSVVTDTFIYPLSKRVLPEKAVFESDNTLPCYDRGLAQQALDSLNTEGGMRTAVNVDPHQQFKDWGLVPIQIEEDLL